MFEPSSDEPVKQRARFSRPSVRILKAWYNAHRGHPYPNEDEKLELQDQTGLSKKQISYWFINARRRTQTVVPAEWSQMNALNRWRHSPPELEPASFVDIADAVATARISSALRSSNEMEHPSYSDSSSQSVSIHGFSDTSSSQSSSAASGDLQSLAWDGEVTRRRRRRNKFKPSLSHSEHGTVEERKYQCTFCTDRFKTKFDWTRHEKSKHLSLERWTCAPFGPLMYVTGEITPRCAFCSAPTPSDSHLQDHRYADCEQKPLAARTFYRKDHLLQHLHLFHRVDQPCASIGEWRSTRTSIQCRCGFCGETFDEWSLRNSHLASHFLDGAQMKDWKGCRGLEPAVAMLVQNAMPPYLIGSEAIAIEPFSAEGGRLHRDTHGGASACENNINTCQQQQNGPTSFEVLVSSLSTFVVEQKRLNIELTNEQLQRQARLIVFGEDDPWNQTAADNIQWLELFKMGHGLGGNQAACSAVLGVHGPAKDDAASQLPWYWQSPECLAEFRQCEAPFGIEAGCSGLETHVLAEEQMQQSCNPVEVPVGRLSTKHTSQLAKSREETDVSEMADGAERSCVEDPGPNNKAHLVVRGSHPLPATTDLGDLFALDDFVADGMFDSGCVDPAEITLHQQ